MVGSADPAGDVARFVAAERRRRGLPPLSRDAGLDRVAGTQVRNAASADVMKLDRGVAGTALDEVPDLSTAVAELYVGSAPDEVQSSKNLGEAKWTRLGVGAVYASSKQYGPGRLWVVLLYGR